MNIEHANPMAGAFLERSHPEYRAENNAAPEIGADIMDDEAAQAARLAGIANQIRAWQEAQRPKISNEAMVRRFPGLGSTKTYRRLCDGDFDGLVVVNHLARLNGVWNQIELARAAAPEEEIYEDITPAMNTGLAIAGAIPQTGQTRLVVIEGPTGSGKTQSLRLAAKRYAGNVAWCEATEGWGSLNAALGDMLVATRAHHGDDMPAGNAARLGALVAALRARKLTLLIDEGHHMTAATLNVLKTLINQTPVVIIIAGIDTLWRKLTNRSWEEAKQLLLNRLYERVRLGPPAESDAARFVERRLHGHLAADWKKALPTVCQCAAIGGYWAFLRRLCDVLLADVSDPLGANDLAIAARGLAGRLETQGKR